MIKYLKDGFYYYFFHSIGLRGLFILSEDIEICKEQAPFFRSSLVRDTSFGDFAWTEEIFSLLDSDEGITFYSDPSISPEDFLRKRKLIDFSVTFRPCDRIPAIDRQVYRYGRTAFTVNDKWEQFAFETWHSKSAGKPPYTYVHFTAPGHMEVLYLPEYSYMVSLSRQIFDLVSMESLFLDHKRFLLHSSLVDFEGKGILFSAPSGSGKSTQADLWGKYENAEILNGDVSGICKKADGYYAYGLPWAGSSGIYRNESVKIRMIIMLSKGSENILKPMTAPFSVMNLYSQVFMHRFDPAFVDISMGMIEEMVDKVPVYSFCCRPDADAVEVLKSVGLENRMKNFPSQLSGGEQQRVAIARALAKNPKLLLCDEPTGALDYQTGKAILKLLQSLSNEKGMTVVIITHNSALTAMADRVIRVKNGKITSNVVNTSPVNVDRIEW